METIKLDRISKEALEINQRIVGALKASLDEYKSEKLTARLVSILKKHLPESEFSVWMSFEKSFNWYRLHIAPINISQFYSDPDAMFRQEREGKSFYAVRYDDQITVSDYLGNPVNWREKLVFSINRFDDLDGWEWEQNREPFLEQFAALEQQAMEIKAKAEALLASIPKPEHDPLGRWNFVSDYKLQQAFPHAFHYYERR